VAVTHTAHTDALRVDTLVCCVSKKQNELKIHFFCFSAFEIRRRPKRARLSKEVVGLARAHSAKNTFITHTRWGEERKSSYLFDIVQE